MKDIDQKLIEKELDKVLDLYDSEEFDSQKFINYSRTIKQTLLKSIGNHNKSRECVFPNCTNKSIKKSHSIPKSSSLKIIASNGHLLTPYFDFNTKIPLVTMQRIGVKKASAFPGFCEMHENIFKSFEIDGKIDKPRKALLQIYRTLCRERVFREGKSELKLMKRFCLLISRKLIMRL